jgi:hypothetical protein
VTLGADKPPDPGVAVWFTWDGLSVCIPVDRYLTVAANLQAIHHVIEARRVELRHGTLALVRATFTGFAALPPPNTGGDILAPTWWEVLGVRRGATEAEIKAAHRKAIRDGHPDAGGSPGWAADLNAARDAGLKERGHG